MQRGTMQRGTMRRGRGRNYKGRSRHFTDPEELEEQRRQDERKQQWIQYKPKDSSNAKDDEAKARAYSPDMSNSSSSDSETDSDSDSETEVKTKGVENLIQIENPNRVQMRAKKLSHLNEPVSTAKPNLSRREREQLEKQRAYANYQKLHAEGKTEEARADLARLAIIKKQREEAAQKREEEKKQRELAQQKKAEFMQKVLGKKS